MEFNKEGIMEFQEFSTKYCQYYIQGIKSDDIDICERDKTECCEGLCPLWKGAKIILETARANRS